MNIIIEGKMVRMQVDTGSANTLLPESLYEKYWSHIMMSQNQCKLNSYSGQSIPYKGLLTVNVRHDIGLINSLYLLFVATVFHC